ncbi:MAG: hypothetical protein AAF514_22150 [Verrucomicrobiota bacterium]
MKSPRFFQIFQERMVDWLLISPVKASEWVDGLESGVVRDRAVASLVSGLLSDRNPAPDLEAAGHWIEAMEEGALKEQWEVNLADRRASQNPDQPE